MYKTMVLINTFAKARRFCSLVSHMDGDFDLSSDRYTVDAKSFLGLFSLDLNDPIELTIHSEENLDDILRQLTPYIVDPQKRTNE